MIADLQRTLALIRHMTICANNSGTCMNPLIPHFKLWMLCFEHRRARVRVLPVFELLLIVKSKDVLNQKTLGPWVDQPFLGTTEVILVVTLPANESAHLLPCRLLVH